MKFNRRKTRQIQIGKVGIGSDFPISVQSMTTTKTKDAEGNLLFQLKAYMIQSLMVRSNV